MLFFIYFLQMDILPVIRRPKTLKRRRSSHSVKSNIATSSSEEMDTVAPPPSPNSEGGVLDTGASCSSACFPNSEDMDTGAPTPNSEGVLADTGACCSSASFPSSEDISDTVAPPPPNSEGVLVDTGASCSSELKIERPLKSILKRRHCPSIIIQPSSPSSEDISDTVPPPSLTVRIWTLVPPS